MGGCLNKEPSKKLSNSSSNNNNKVNNKSNQSNNNNDDIPQNNSGKPPIIANNFEELPPDIKKLLECEEIDISTITGDNFRMLLRILMFTNGGQIFKMSSNKQSKPINNENNNEKKNQNKEKTPDVDTEAVASDDILKKTESSLIEEPNIKKLFKNTELSGHGGFGRVYSAIRSSDKQQVAIKKMPHSSQKEKLRNLSEIGFMASCDHPNIVKYFCTYKVNQEVWVIMEFMQGGTLSEASKIYEFKDPQIAYVAREMLKGIKYLHDRGYAHRDLKSSNVMLTIQGDVKLIDFGLCVDMSKGPKHHMVGSPFWMPPEMIRNQPHSLSADIWSLGVSLIEMANKKPPYRESHTKAMYIVGLEGYDKFINNQPYSDEFKNFLFICCKLNPKERATAEQLLQNPFLNKADTKENMKTIISSVFVSNALTSGGIF